MAAGTEAFNPRLTEVNLRGNPSEKILRLNAYNSGQELFVNYRVLIHATGLVQIIPSLLKAITR